MWLTSVGFYLCLDALLIELAQTIVHHFFVAHIVRIGYHLYVAGSSMVVALVAFLNALIAGENPVEKLGEPSLQGLRVLLGEGFGTFQQLNAIEHLDKRIGIDDSITASLAIVKAGHNLSMVEIRVHAGFLVQEPHTQQLYSLLGITFVTAEVPSQRKCGYACCHFRQLRTVQTLQLWIRNAVATDVWESVGLRLVGPEVATQAHIVVFVAAGSSLLLHHH